MFIVSIDLLLGKPGRTKTSGEEHGEEREDVSIFPLAIPMLAGPGTITTILLYVSEDKSPGVHPAGPDRKRRAGPRDRRRDNAI